ncbi:MAG: hypothetical protein KDC76_00910 [Bacteroidetes bacterium]|nr:hypothetical protein [Bacteroidota bacterium]
MKHLLPLFVLITLACLSASAQHKILYVSGSKTLKVGTISSYPVNLESGQAAYIENTAGKIIRVSGPVKLKKTDLESRFSKEVGLSQTYFAYVLKKMTTKHDDAQHSFGGVTRGEGPILNEWPINGQMILDDSIRFSWRNREGVQTYFVNVMDDDENIVLKLSVSDTFFTLHHPNLVLGSGRTYAWFVADQLYGEEGKTHFFLPSADSAQAVKSDFAQLSSILMPQTPMGMYQNTVENELAVIGFCLNHDLYQEAMGRLSYLRHVANDANLVALIEKEILAGNSDGH